MDIKQIQNKNEWEKFVLAQPSTIFVQSYKYGEFYVRMGEVSWIFGIYDGDRLIGGSLVVSTHAKRGDFLYLPYGPILPKNNTEEALLKFSQYLLNFAKKNRYNFVRVSPFMDEDDKIKQIFKKAGYRNAPIHVLAETTWLLDLTPSENQLMNDMKKNHRNLIRRCIKEGVVIEKSTDVNKLKAFNRIHDKTAMRHNFHRFSDKYVKEEFSSFTSENQAMIFNAYLSDGRLDSSSIIMFYGNMASYRHSGSLNLDNKIPTSYLLQWEAIKEAKKRGIRYYNFWGIAPEDSNKNHPFKGITHFKKGFGGFQKDLLNCQDMPVSWKYWLNWIIEIFRSINRGFK